MTGTGHRVSGIARARSLDWLDVPVIRCHCGIQVPLRILIDRFNKWVDLMFIGFIYRSQQNKYQNKSKIPQKK
jgi:hypothetical protein